VHPAIARLPLGPILGTLAAGLLTAQPRQWADLARRDLEAIRTTILEHHPGPVDSLNPRYRHALEAGYQRALAKADSVTSIGGLIATLDFFVTSFEDGHLGWSSDWVPRDLQWPGFVVGRRQGRYLVYSVDPGTRNGPPPMSEILACEGVPIEERMTREVMPYAGGIPSLEASRARLAPSLFLGDGNPWQTRPRACRIRDPSGEREVALSWRAIDPDRAARLQREAAFGAAPTEFELTTPAPGVAWVTIPSFAENQGNAREGLERLERAMASIRRSRLIVFDVRGNRGGNSVWGDRIGAALLGGNYVGALRARLGGAQYVQWRASAGNAEFIERSTIPRYEAGSPSRAALVQVVAAIRAAIEQGRPLTPAPAGGAAPAPAGPVPAHALGERIVLLTDGWCASACLDFADLILAVPGARHAGAPTYADAVYIDNRAIMLPSELGRFGFSMKVYRNRPRGHNQPYLPSLIYRGTVWSTAELGRWLLPLAGSR
jgi:hypothetical protein